MTVAGDVNDNYFEANTYKPLIFNQFLHEDLDLQAHNGEFKIIQPTLLF